MRLPHLVQGPKRAFKRTLRGFGLFVAFLVGRVPVHRFRLLVYRRAFGMRLGEGSSVH